MNDLIPVTILISAQSTADKLALCLNSLIRFAPDYVKVYVLADVSSDDSIADVCQAVSTARISIECVQNGQSQGSSVMRNWAANNLWHNNSDLLLLDSDTEITEGVIEELQFVLHLHEKHALVMPRSNNAALLSVPSTGPLLSSQDSYALWLKIRRQLSRYSVMPVAVGFCLLLKRIIYERFGLFDLTYGFGFNQENEFLRRINRYGYSGVAANRAFVFRNQSLPANGLQKGQEESDYERLVQCYPEYERIVTEHVQFFQEPVDAFARLYLNHRPCILFDLFHLTPSYTGTSEFGLNLLREVTQLIEDEFEIYVGINEPEGFFDNILAGYRIYEDKPDQQMQFDLLVKPCQVFSWHELQRMNRLAPRITWVLQDIIAVRCDYLNSAVRRDLLDKAVKLSNRVFTISQSSKKDYEAFYGHETDLKIIYHGTNEPSSNGLPCVRDYVLLIGNTYSHKGIEDVLKHLDRRHSVVVIGGPESAKRYDNVRWFQSGNLNHLTMRELTFGARLLVFPSHYEGFGLPAMDALAAGIPVIVLTSQVNKEIESLYPEACLKIIKSSTELNEAIEEVTLFQANRQCYSSVRKWRGTAEEYVAEFRRLLTKPVNPSSLTLRSKALKLSVLDG